MGEQFPHYIEFRHVYKTFDRPVLVDSNFHVDAGETVAIIESLEGLAEVACVLGDAALGVRLFGATNTLREAHSLPVPASYGREQERVLAAARITLGEQIFSLEWARGQAMSMEQAIAESGNVPRVRVTERAAP